MRDEHDAYGRTVRVGAGIRPEDNARYDAGAFRTNVSGNGWRSLRPGDAWTPRSFRQTGRAFEDPGLVPDWRQRPPGAGSADDRSVREACRIRTDGGPRFDQAVPPGGYIWWYADGLSEDGTFGVTVIAFVGSVCSPYYAWSGRNSPDNHCSLNVALYGPGVGRWAMTERDRDATSRSTVNLAIGPSALTWDGATLVIDIDEVCAPIPKRIQGKIRLTPQFMTPDVFELDRGCQHSWWPIAPRSRIEVDLEEPNLSWSGEGYLDMNAGDVPLEATFKNWDWSRAHCDGDTNVLYHITERSGLTHALGLTIDPDGRTRRFQPGERHNLPKAFWRVDRSTLVDKDKTARVVQTLEDSPFYARSLIQTHILGKQTLAIHESLSLDKFDTRIVKLMLPFRMPRAAGLLSHVFKSGS